MPLRAPYVLLLTRAILLHQLIATWESYQQVLLRKANPQTPRLPLPALTEVSFVNGSRTSSEEFDGFLGLVFGTVAYLYLLTFTALIIEDGLGTMNTGGRIGNASGVCWPRLDFSE